MKRDEAVSLLRGRLNGRQRNRLARLLNMLYTPRELAEEIGFTVRQVYRAYLPAGCPHTRDERRHVWINGKDFREWAEDAYRKRTLAYDEAYCLTCRRPVPVVDAVRHQDGRTVYLLCNCPKCGRRLARIVEKKRRGE